MKFLVGKDFIIYLVCEKLNKLAVDTDPLIKNPDPDEMIHSNGFQSPALF